MTEEVVPEPIDVELVIRSAYQTTGDIKFTCLRSWTIKQVKEHIRDTADNHPAVTTQRLIFSGAALQDDKILADVLREKSVVDGPQIFHLVCSQPYSNPDAATARRRNVQATNPVPEAPAMGEPQPAPATMTWENYMATYGQPGQLTQPYYHNYYNEWVRYYQYQSYMAQMYAPEYQAQIQAQIAAMGTASAQMMQMNPQVAQPAAPAGIANNARNVFNAAVRRVNVPVGGNREARGGGWDYLDMFYRCFKLVIVFSAVLLYSSFERFVAVFVAALFIYFVQLRRNNARNNPDAPQRAPAAPPAAPAGDAPAEGTEEPVNNNNTGENENTGNEENGSPVAPDSPNAMQVFIATCYSFVTSFFASLVPDHHQFPVDIN